MISRVVLDSSATVWSVAILVGRGGDRGRRGQRGGGRRGEARSESHARVTAAPAGMFRLLCASIAAAIRLSTVRLLTIVAFAVLLAAAPRPRGRVISTAASRTTAGPRTARDGGGYVVGLALLDRRRPLLTVGSAYSGKPVPTALTLTAGGRLASRTAFPPPAVRPPRFAERLRAGADRDRADALPARAHRSGRGGLTLPAVIDGRRLDLEVGGFGVDGQGRAL